MGEAELRAKDIVATGGVVVADLSKDGAPEIVFTTYSTQDGYGELFVLDGGGNPLHRLPLPGRGAMPVLMLRGGGHDLLIRSFRAGFEAWLQRAPDPHERRRLRRRRRRMFRCHGELRRYAAREQHGRAAPERGGGAALVPARRQSQADELHHATVCREGPFHDTTIPSPASSSGGATSATVPGGFWYQPGSPSPASCSRTFTIVNMPPIVM